MNARVRCGLILVGIGAVVAGVAVSLYRPSGRAFDRMIWQDEARVAQGVRLEMADRLVAEGELLGRSRAEVVNLLGEPPPTAYFSDWDLVYWLGPERGFFGIDSEWLVLRLDAKGSVADLRVVTD
jgi:hypothetical protein